MSNGGQGQGDAQQVVPADVPAALRASGPRLNNGVMFLGDQPNE